MKKIRRLLNWLAIALLIASIITELRKPKSERTWHGKLMGFVPYDLRLPNFARARATFWDPDNPNALVPTLFGVGWSVNLAAVYDALRAGE
jgi:hypothetical protein